MLAECSVRLVDLYRVSSLLVDEQKACVDLELVCRYGRDE